MDEQKLPYDLGVLADAFDLEIAADCPHLEEWLNATATLDPVEQAMFDYLYEQVKVDGKYWNEEELKIRYESRSTQHGASTHDPTQHHLPTFSRHGALCPTLWL